MMLKCLAVDDEPLALTLLKNYVSKAPQLELVEATSNVYAALQVAQQNKADLIFLDIQMPELTGIQFMKILGGSCKVVLTTAYEEYALQAFEHDVVDYLLKPFSFERFMMAVKRAEERIHSVPPLPATQQDFIFVKSEYRMLKINFADILYLEGLRDYVAIHTPSGKVLTLQSLRSFEESLPADRFIRVHKSYIVSFEKINRIEKKKAILHNTEIPIGETYSAKLRERMS